MPSHSVITHPVAADESSAINVLQKGYLASITGGHKDDPFHKLLNLAAAAGVMGVGFGEEAHGMVPGLRVYAFEGFNVGSLPNTFQGKRVQIISTSPWRFSALSFGGTVISGAIGEGTLGCIVTPNHPDEDEAQQYVLSASHVLAGYANVANSDLYDDARITNPAAPPIGQLSANCPIQLHVDNQMDAAIGCLNDEVPATFSTGYVSGASAVPNPNVAVRKMGKKSFLTTGYIYDKDASFSMFASIFASYTFVNQIIVKGDNGLPFSLEGDSGSLVVTNPGLNPIGLLFAANSHNMSIVTPINRILNFFDVSII